MYYSPNVHASTQLYLHKKCNCVDRSDPKDPRILKIQNSKKKHVQSGNILAFFHLKLYRRSLGRRTQFLGEERQIQWHKTLQISRANVVLRENQGEDDN